MPPSKYCTPKPCIALLVFLLSQLPAYADDSCQLKHIQCANPSFQSCNSGFGAGQCIKKGYGVTNETCSMVTFPNGFSGSYRDQPVTCNEADGCEAVSCPQDCINDPSISCSCVAQWGLNGLIHFEPAFCLSGSIDGSCHQQFFECIKVNFNFCYQGYGTGLCQNGQHTGRNCTVSYYPDSFNNTINGHHLECEYPAGCENIVCSDGCHGSWQLNHKTEVVPGNCAANRGKSCELSFLHCKNTSFNFCSEGYGKGYCQNPVSRENCTVTVLPDHQTKSCSNPDGCEQLSCPSCHAYWMINNRTSITPEGCASGLNDDSCRLCFFQCSRLSLDFCQNGYGLGRCYNDAQKTGCTVHFVPDHFSFVDSEGRAHDCQQTSGCEWLNCDNDCRGHGYEGWQETTPGNCLPTASKPCQLQYFSCDDQQFDSCKGGYGTGTCSNSETVETCDITVYPKGWRESPDNPVLCSNDQGCEEVQCPEGCEDDCDCAGQWHVYGKTNTYPQGCLDHHSSPKSTDGIALALGISGGVVLLATATVACVTLVACICRYSRHSTYQRISSTN